MANTYKFIDMVAREALSELHEQCELLATVDRQYDDSFGKNGAKIGDTLRVRKPNEFNIRTGNAMEINAITEATQDITMSTLKGVDMEFSYVDSLLKTDSPKDVANFTKRYIRPAISKLISVVESEALTYYTKATYQLAGTAGNAINSLSTPNLARAKLNQMAAPKTDRHVQIDSTSMASLVAGVPTYFNPAAAIAKQYTEGFVTRTAMADFHENERCWTLANGADVAGEINGGTLTSGITTLTVDGFTAAPAVGSVFTIGSGSGETGVYNVHPETKVAYAQLKQFTVTSATTTSITFTPAIIYDTTDPRQNCSGAPADNADIAFVGALSTSYVQPIMYHKEAFQFVNAPLEVMDDADKCSVETREGMSLRVWRGSDITNNRRVLRIDMLYGFAALRSEWACRMIGSAN
jgi:hypothetical protein